MSQPARAMPTPVVVTSGIQRDTYTATRTLSSAGASITVAVDLDVLVEMPEELIAAMQAAVQRVADAFEAPAAPAAVGADITP